MKPWIWGLMALFSFGVTAATSSPFDTFLGQFEPNCQRRLRATSEFKLLFSSPGVRDFLVKKKETPSTLTAALSGWSTDLILKNILFLEQEILPQCAKAGQLQPFSQELKSTFLESLGINTRAMSSEAVTLLFRGVAVAKKDFASVKERLVGSTSQEPEAVVKTVYGLPATVKSGIWVIGFDPAALSRFEKWIAEICGGTNPCAFWNERVLYRVVLTPDKGVGIFIPELATLHLSQDLFAADKMLHEFVLMHELAHAWDHAAKLESGKPLSEQFAQAAGWSKKKGRWTISRRNVASERNDLLTQQSPGSPFSILPDAVVENFPLAKSYLESTRRNDPSEDFADSVAAYRLLPERFCWKGKKLAPRKTDFLKKHFPYPTAAPNC